MQIRRSWPYVRILVRADSGFAREELMAWCEANGVHFLFGLARNERNERLVAEINSELGNWAEAKGLRTGKPARFFKKLMWMTRRSWCRERRVVQGGANPRSNTDNAASPSGNIPCRRTRSARDGPAGGEAASPAAALQQVKRRPQRRMETFRRNPHPACPEFDYRSGFCDPEQRLAVRLPVPRPCAKCR